MRNQIVKIHGRGACELLENAQENDQTPMYIMQKKASSRRHRNSRENRREEKKHKHLEDDKRNDRENIKKTIGQKTIYIAGERQERC